MQVAGEVVGILIFLLFLLIILVIFIAVFVRYIYNSDKTITYIQEHIAPEYIVTLTKHREMDPNFVILNSRLQITQTR